MDVHGHAMEHVWDKYAVSRPWSEVCFTNTIGSDVHPTDARENRRVYFWIGSGLGLGLLVPIG